MRYGVVSCDVTTEKSIEVGAELDGAAITLRHGQRPVGFVLLPMRRDAKVRRIDVASLIDHATAQRLCIESMRAELAAPGGLTACGALSITVAICTKDRPALLERCLVSLAALDPASVSALGMFEILVVDNAPTTDAARSVVASHRGVRYIREPKAGLNFARNRALVDARGDFVAYLDDDIRVDADWLRALVQAWLAHPQAALFTGQVLPFEIETKAQLLFEQRGGFRRGFERVVFGSERAGDPVYPCSVGILGTGANMTVRRDAALQLGGFDIALDTGAALPGGGDLDMFYRILRSGRRAVYEPASIVFHQHRRDMAGLRRQYRDSWGTAFMAFAIKSWRTDPPMRRRWSTLIARWFGKQGTHLARRLVGQHHRPATLIINEAVGGVVGILGAYGRSQRRVQRIARNVG